ncbi:complement inhibitor RaCI2-like [Rhipicephalus microplus]|uniref:Putative conserved secreted protein n=1 Tax=Rhipicephalus microplus TaxID=6941 RepID=A0A6G5A887_RHIMP
MKAVIVLAFTAFALIIHDCYSTEEDTTPMSFKDKCANVTCHRTVDNSGKRRIDGCPPGCRCVLQGPDSRDHMNGSCYLLTTTRKSQ